jgi:hypothetical protein
MLIRVSKSTKTFYVGLLLKKAKQERGQQVVKVNEEQ